MSDPDVIPKICVCCWIFFYYNVEEINDRKIIAEDLSVKFPDIEFKVAGETGIDMCINNTMYYGFMMW